MTKFKVGDKVRALDSYSFAKIRVGDIYTIGDLKYDDYNGTFRGYFLKEKSTHGYWSLDHFELVTDEIKVGDYVSIGNTDQFSRDGKSKTGTVSSVQTYATVKSDSGQDYVRKLDELALAVKPDPIPVEPAHNTAFRFSNSSFTWVWDVGGWSYLQSDGTKSGNRESWKSLWGRYIGSPKSKNSFTVL